MTPAEKESHEREAFVPEEPEDLAGQREGGRRAADSAEKTRFAPDAIDEGAGETTDVLRDACQEQGEDNTALSAEEQAAEWPLASRRGEGNKPAGALADRRSSAPQSGTTQPRAQKLPGSQETAGEAEDVVADSTQETQIDSTAYAAEEDENHTSGSSPKADRSKGSDPTA